LIVYFLEEFCDRCEGIDETGDHELGEAEEENDEVSFGVNFELIDCWECFH